MTLLHVNILNPEHANIENPSARPFDLAIITFSSPKYTQRDIKKTLCVKIRFIEENYNFYTLTDLENTVAYGIQYTVIHFNRSIMVFYQHLIRGKMNLSLKI